MFSEQFVCSASFDQAIAHFIFVATADGAISVFDVRNKPKCTHVIDFPQVAREIRTTENY